jgi:hypothetical protein
MTKTLLLSYRGSGRILIGAEDYAYILPHPGLRSWISNYTLTFPSAGMMSDGYAVIPHGCATLVFSADASGFTSNLFGPCTKPVTVGRSANQSDFLFIVEFSARRVLRVQRYAAKGADRLRTSLRRGKPRHEPPDR